MGGMWVAVGWRMRGVNINMPTVDSRLCCSCSWTLSLAFPADATCIACVSQQQVSVCVGRVCGMCGCQKFSTGNTPMGVAAKR